MIPKTSLYSIDILIVNENQMRLCVCVRVYVSIDKMLDKALRRKPYQYGPSKSYIQICTRVYDFFCFLFIETLIIY